MIPTVGYEVRSLREKRGLTVSQLAKKLWMDESLLVDIENGRVRVPMCVFEEMSNFLTRSATWHAGLHIWLVTGSRKHESKEVVLRNFDPIEPERTRVLVGDAADVDEWVFDECVKREIDVYKYVAQTGEIFLSSPEGVSGSVLVDRWMWGESLESIHPRHRPLARNRAMVLKARELSHCFRCLAFPFGEARGTYHTAALAALYGGLVSVYQTGE